jgi:hypothetical protein
LQEFADSSNKIFYLKCNKIYYNLILKIKHYEKSSSNRCNRICRSTHSKELADRGYAVEALVRDASK